MRSNNMLPLILIILVGCGGGITAQKMLDYDGLIKSGWSKYNQNKFDDAYQIFLSAKDMEDERAEGYIGCGWSHLMRQHPDSALVEFFLGYDYIESLNDTVDAVCGIAGSYLAHGENSRVITFLKGYDLKYFDQVFPLNDHDYFFDGGDLEMVLAQSYYRLGWYSPAESADPENALYHLDQVLIAPHEYIDPEDLMIRMTEYMSQSEGGYLQ